MSLNQSGLLFVPRGWQRADILRWLKRTHAWTGFWGALLFLMMGTSGFFLNHRQQLKIDTGEPVEVNRMAIAVRPGQFADADAMGAWAKRELGLPGEARPPRAEEPPGGKGNPRQERRFLGKPHREAESWTRVFTLANGRVIADYIPGSASVIVRREEQGVLSTIKNLHKGVGLGVGWVLLIDTIAGALVTMSVTGFLLWTRLHGTRVLAGGLAAGSLVWAIAAAAPSFG